MSSEPKVGPESDTDSMAEYGEGDTGKRFVSGINNYNLLNNKK